MKIFFTLLLFIIGLMGYSQTNTIELSVPSVTDTVYFSKLFSQKEVKERLMNFNIKIQVNDTLKCCDLKIYDTDFKGTLYGKPSKIYFVNLLDMILIRKEGDL